jgi:hypothetical protein
MRRATALILGTACALAAATAGTAGIQALITGAQIKDGTVESRDIGNGTIRRADIADATEAALRGQRGPRGAAGEQGPAGPAGLAGPAGSVGQQGATGAAGPQGPAGAQGPQGDVGEGLHVTGSVDDASDLPEDATTGDAYIVTADGHLHVWDGEAWIDAGLVRGPAGPTGAAGPAGPQGAAGPAGQTGPAGAAGADGADGGLAGYQIVTGTPEPVQGGDVETVSVSCPAGKLATGGGASVADPSAAGITVESFPLAAGAGWRASVWNESDDSTTVTPYAVCADAA